jgi:hypothetical protein
MPEDEDHAQHQNPSGRRSKFSKLIRSLFVHWIAAVPFGKFLIKLFQKEGKSIKEGWIVFLAAIVTSLVLGIYYSRSYYFEPRLQDLHQQLNDATRERDTLRTQLEIAENALAPLRMMAADMQYRHQSTNINSGDLLTHAEILVRLVTERPGETDDMWGDFGADGFPPPNKVRFYKDGVIPILTAGCWDLSEHQIDSTHAECRFTAILLPKESACLNRPLFDLNSCDLAEIDLGTSYLPEGTRVTDGKLLLFLNNSILLKFDVPRQTVTKGKIEIYNLDPGFLPLQKESSH